jgi:hypothetical protein
MWRVIDNGKDAGKGGHMPSPMPLHDCIYLLFDNEEIAGFSCLLVRPDNQRNSVEEAIRAGEAFMNRPKAEECATEGGVIDMDGNTVSRSHPIAERSL